MKRTLFVKSNKKARTFTIRVFADGIMYVKYRTIKMSKDEFNSGLSATEDDWFYFLDASNDYYTVTEKYN